MKVTQPLILTLAGLYLMGCATVFKGSTREVAFNTEPAGAEVFVNGRKLGNTPVEVELESRVTHSIEIKKAGYAPHTLVITNNLGAGWVVLDVLFGLWPALIDLATGAWFNLDRDQVFANLTESTPATETVARSAAGFQQFQGERQRLTQPALKCAAMPLQTTGVNEALTTVIDEILLAELQKAGFEAVGPDDINAMLGFERTKQAVGCDDATCIAEIGGALGVDYLAIGKIAIVDETPFVTLKLIDVSKARVLARSTRSASLGVNTLPRLIGEAVQEIVVSSHL
jgi:hypothetical protein